MTRDADAKKLGVFAKGAGTVEGTDVDPTLFDNTTAGEVNFINGFPSSYEAIAGTTSYPTRLQFNSLFRLITALGAEINRRGTTLEWDSTLEYEDDAIVMHGGTLYQARAAVAAGGSAPPAGDWELLIPPSPLASATVAGLVELATVAEAMAGTDTARAITAQGLVATIQKEAAGILDWRMNVTYSRYDLVVGSDGTLYQAVAGSTNVNPVTRANDSQWEEFSVAATVSRHDSPAITLDAPTGSVVNTSSTLGTSAVAQIFQPVLVAARARGGYSIGDEVTPLGGSVPATVRKVNDRSFAVYAAAGDIELQRANPNGLYIFGNNSPSSVWQHSLPVPTSGFALGATLANSANESFSGATYWPVAGEEKIFAVGANSTLLSFPLPWGASTSLGNVFGSTIITRGLAAHEVSGDMRLYGVRSHGANNLLRINPASAGDTTGDYGVVSGDLPGFQNGPYNGLSSHNGKLYGLVGQNNNRLVDIDIANPANSTILTGDLPLNQSYGSLFSDGTNLFYLSGLNLYRISTLTSSAAAATLVGAATGTTRRVNAACVVSGLPPLTQTFRLGNTGDSTADFNLKIRYSA